MNVVGEALEQGHKIIEETCGALVNTFLPSLEGGCFESERKRTRRVSRKMMRGSRAVPVSSSSRALRE